MERSVRHAQAARTANLRQVRAFRSILPHSCQGLHIAARSRLSASRGRFDTAEIGENTISSSFQLFHFIIRERK